MLGVGSYHSYDLIGMRLAARSCPRLLCQGLVLTLFTKGRAEGMLNLTSSESCLSQQVPARLADDKRSLHHDAKEMCGITRR